MTLSNSELNNICPHGRGSTKSKKESTSKFHTLNSSHLHLDLNLIEQQRRVSMGAAMKGNFVVSQSDLWDTQTLSHAKQHSRHSPRNQQGRCPDHTYVNAPIQTQSTPSSSLATTPQHEQQQYNENGSPGGLSTGSGNAGGGMMQRSVSEKNRKHRHKQKITVCQSETDSEREQRTLCAQNRKLVKSHHSHHQSTPNVAPDGSQTSIKTHKHRSKSRDHHHHHRASNLYGACSESELLDSDTAILPIFRKLLTEKESRYRSRNVGASCPNISIKCDIVEYL